MFEDVKFKGTFRSYQQKILDKADKYLADGKINVVAAPGSGKTVLGLELIRRLGLPCLIFSPTTTIRDQWGERYAEMFECADGSKAEVSFDLRKPKGITSVTYQALYSAVGHVRCEEEDFSDVDIFGLVKTAGIGAVCLDEAHHLQNEWQKALETFVTRLGGSVKIISLTATPPYDATPAEWQRYIDVCGEIDEEIFVPELVKQGSLCPHQDFVYFNFPTKEDIGQFSEYRDRVENCLLEMKYSEALPRLFKKLCNLSDDGSAELYMDREQTSAMFAVFARYGFVPDADLALDFKSSLKYDASVAEKGFNFMLSFEHFPEEDREKLKETFRKHKVMENGKVALDLSVKLKSRLCSSAGKLESIYKISVCEYKSLGEKLRLLALTDYIKRENLSGLGTDCAFDGLNIVSVFETVRRAGLPVGALSGGLVILPTQADEKLNKMGARFKTEPLGADGYSEFIFSGDNKEKVNFVGKLFEDGDILALVGTKSLLGEGWDAPCVNSLILASFVGSFMLSNQMRGRAIRTYGGDSGKTANIWHLVTVEPKLLLDENKKEDTDTFTSADFETLKRRFECFVAPNYGSGIIESGIERITVIHPPYGRDGIERINSETEALAAERGRLKEKWNEALSGGTSVCDRVDVPPNRRFPFDFYNLGLFIILNAVVTAIFGTLIAGFAQGWFGGKNALWAVLGIAASIVLLILANIGVGKIMAHLNPIKSIRTLSGCLVATLKRFNIIGQEGALAVEDYGDGNLVEITLLGADVRDGKIFSEAISELFSAIRNPRYVLIPLDRKGKRKYTHSLACPAVLGVKKEYAEEFAHTLSKYLGRTQACYVRGAENSRIADKCRRASYMNLNEGLIKRYMGTAHVIGD